MLKTENLCKHFEGTRALENINLEIKKGELFALLGMSGAGKTTLLRILNMLEKPTSGRVFFKGTQITKDGLQVKRKMAMVFQGGIVFNRSVYENVAYGLRIRNEDEMSIKKKVEKALELVGLSGYDRRNALTLSSGEKQRVNFAMALAVEPELLLLDEPTANLDPINEKLIEEIISKINRLGITVVLATHKQEEALALAHRIAVLNQGKVEQIGTPEEIFYAPATRFVAEFVGTENILNCRIKSRDGNKMIVTTSRGIEIEVSIVVHETNKEFALCIRPEEIMVIREDARRSYPNLLQGVIREIQPRGKALLRLRVSTGEHELAVDLPRHAARKMELELGKLVTLSIKPEACHLILERSSAEP